MFIIIIIIYMMSFMGIVSNTYIISDSRYDSPYCFNSIYNKYGIVTMDTDILRENLTLSIKLDSIPVYSCYLCDKLKGEYCNTNTSSYNEIGLSSIPFNIMISIVNENSNFPIEMNHGYRILSNRKLVLPLNRLLNN